MHVKQLKVQWFGFRTLADGESVVGYAKGINNTENSGLWTMVIVGAELPIVTKWDSQAKSHKIDRLKEFSIPLLNVMERCMAM
jgi:hypothetical protein